MSVDDLLESPLVKQQLLDMPLFREIISEYSMSKPFKGQKIAIAHVLVPNTLPLIISCIVGGAEVKITDCVPPKNDPEVLELLHSAGYTVDHEFRDATDFDYAIDVNAYFRDLPPKKGISEITRSGIHKYMMQPLKTPVINCDDSIVKTIETFIGNPLAVERAFDRFIGPHNELLSDKKVVVLGFGKIGRGLARIFTEYARVLVLDVDDKVLSKARKLGFETGLIIEDKNENNKFLSDAKVIFTATGHPNVVSTFFDKEAVQASYLLNIGAVDEFGEQYSKDEVFMSKNIPFNFNLTPPTGNKYIDPILVAHVKAIEHMIRENIIRTEIIPFPKFIDNELLSKFEKYNHPVEDLIRKYF
jgi:adenosylhomocysteinase